MAQTPKLVMLSEKFRGKSYELDKDLYTIGRRDQNDIAIKDGTLSGHHCDLIRSGDTYRVRDNDSTNGTRLNNVPLVAGEEHELKNFDVIQLGGVETLFECEDKSAPTMASRTSTGIDLDHTESGISTVNLDNYSPFAAQEKQMRAKQKKIMIASLIGVGVILATLAIILLLSVANMNAN